MEATQELMWERGYASTSPRKILDRAEVGQGSMYHHFGSKEVLAAAAFERSAAATLARAESVLAGSEEDAASRVVGYLLAQRDVLLGCPVGRMASDPDVLASDSLSAILRTTFAQVRALLTEVIATGIAAGGLRAADPAELADTVLAVVQGGYVLARAEGDAEPFERAVRGAAAMLRTDGERGDRAKR